MTLPCMDVLVPCMHADNLKADLRLLAIEQAHDTADRTLICGTDFKRAKHPIFPQLLPMHMTWL